MTENRLNLRNTATGVARLAGREDAVIAVESRDHAKNNGVSPKDQRSRGNNMGKWVGVFLFVFLFFGGFSGVYAQQQQKTAYEKKKDELKIQLLSKYGQRLAQLTINTASSKGDKEFIAWADSLKKGGAKEIAALYGRNAPEIDAINWYANELKKAQNLKTPEEIKREKQQAEADRKKAETDRKKAEEERAEKQKKEWEKREQEIYEHSDFFQLQEKIKNNFEEWNKKGEFEKTEDWQKRLENNSLQQFYKVCAEELQNYTEDYYRFHDELQPYDADAECFPIKFRFKMGYSDDENYIVKIPVSAAKAESFKEKYESYHWRVDAYDYAFINNYLCPQKVVYIEDGYDSPYEDKFILDVPLQNSIEVTFAFNDLKIDNQYAKDAVFNLSKLKEIKENQQKIAEEKQKEKQRLDSLELATYNQKLDSIFEDYNRQLLQNPYNVNQKVLTNYEKIVSKKKWGNKYEEEDNFNHREKEYDNKTEYDNKKKQIKSNFEQLNNNFEQELKSKSPTEYCRIYYTQNPDKKTEADKKFLECRCNYSKREDFDIKFINGNLSNCNCRQNEYSKNGQLFENKNEFDDFYDKGDSVYLQEVEKRAVLHFLKVNSKFVEAMDFQKEKKESAGSALGRGLLGLSEKDYTNENEARKKILSVINESKNKSYYGQIMDFVIETNKELNKEWSKNGQYFDKAEFYEVFISDNYKQILKDKKKGK